MTAELTPVASGTQLCTLEQVRDRVNTVGTSDDPKITALINAVTATFCRRYGREFMPRVTATRTFGLRKNRLDLHPFDLYAATAVTLHPESSATVLTLDSDFMLGPLDGDILTNTFDTLILPDDVSLSSDLWSRFGVARIQIEGEWGIWADVTEVPEDVNDAALLTVLSWYDKPASEVAILNSGDPRQGGPAAPAGWDVPFGAHRKMLPFSRELGVW